MATEWHPYGGLSTPYVDLGELPEHLKSVHQGARNGLPEPGPYVWNRGERARQAEVDARLRAVRERLGIEPVTGYYDARRSVLCRA